MTKELRILRIEPFLAVVVVAAQVFNGCAATATQYQREFGSKSEIVWGYDRGLKVTKDGATVCGDDWDGLSKAVSSVPAAKSLADLARHHHSAGVASSWIGGLVLIGGLILGAAVTVNEHSGTNLESSKSPFDYTGFWIMIGGSTIGPSLIGYGAYLRQQGVADAIDAVNVYNCGLRRGVVLNSPDSVLAISSSTRVSGENPPVTDPLRMFTVTVSTDSAETILNGLVSIAFEQGVYVSVLSFKGIVGVATGLDGPFNEMSAPIRTNDVIYVKVNNLIVYKVTVKEETADNVTMIFNRM